MKSMNNLFYIFIGRYFSPVQCYHKHNILRDSTILLWLPFILNSNTRNRLRGRSEKLILGFEVKENYKNKRKTEVICSRRVSAPFG